MEYIGKYSTSGDVQTAVYNGDLLKPYVALVGNEIDWNSIINYKTIPLTFEILSDGDIIWKATSGPARKTFEYKLNDGDWTSITSTTGGTSIPVVSGDIVQFRGNNTSMSAGSAYQTRVGGSASFKVYGNIMSLIDSTNFSTLTSLTSDYTFSYLFNSCTGLTDASNLLLPATTLRNYCYKNMFSNCTSLTTGPSILPATTLAIYCYQQMFNGCTSLVNAPELPTTTLAGGCYHGMFVSCTSLTTAPELPATTLVTECYREMFNSCTNLNYIKCLATNISATLCTNNWVNGVAATGTFVTPSTTTWGSGNSGIPSGWTRVDV